MRPRTDHLRRKGAGATSDRRQQAGPSAAGLGAAAFYTPHFNVWENPARVVYPRVRFEGMAAFDFDIPSLEQLNRFHAPPAPAHPRMPSSPLHAVANSLGVPGADGLTTPIGAAVGHSAGASTASAVAPARGSAAPDGTAVSHAQPAAGAGRALGASPSTAGPSSAARGAPPVAAAAHPPAPPPRRPVPAVHLRDGPDAPSFGAAFADLFAAVLPGAPALVAPPPAAAAPPPPPSKLTLLVNKRQKGNPVLAHVKRVWWEFADVAPDFVVGASTAALFLSLRYHAQHPTGLYARLRTLGGARGAAYTQRIVLVLADVDDVAVLLLNATRQAHACGATIVVAGSPAEAARYLETFKAYEHKPATAIRERVDGGYLPLATELLTSVRSVNRTDVLTLLSTFGSVAAVLTASRAQLEACPGFGEKKVARLWEAMHAPLARQVGGGAGGGGATSGGDAAPAPTVAASAAAADGGVG